MKNYLYGICNDRLHLFTLEKVEEKRDLPPFDGILISGRDCETFLIDVPRLKENEIFPFLSYRIRSIYPAPPENTTFDYRIINGTESKKAIVCVGQKDRISRYKELEKRRLFHPLSFMTPPFFKGTDRTILIFWGDSFLAIQVADAVPVECYSYLSGSKDPKSVIAEKALSSSVEIIAPNVFLPDLKKSFSNGFNFIGASSMEEKLSQLSGKSGTMFIRKDNSVPIRRVLLLAILIIITAIPVSFTRYIHNLKKQASLLEKEIKSFKNTGNLPDTTVTEIDNMKKKLVFVISNKPFPLYSFLADLRRNLGRNVYIKTLILKNNGFQINAVGQNPLELMANFEKDNNFQNVKPSRITPLAGMNKDEFNLTGSYNND